MVSPSEAMAIRRTGQAHVLMPLLPTGNCQLALFYLEKEKTWPGGAIMD
jgi:hypothetical protein